MQNSRHIEGVLQINNNHTVMYEAIRKELCGAAVEAKSILRAQVLNVGPFVVTARTTFPCSHVTHTRHIKKAVHMF